MLSSKQIEIFYEVYKHLSMTAAANKMEISQPSVSKTLGNIEKKLGFKLFIRKQLNYTKKYLNISIRKRSSRRAGRTHSRKT